MDGMQCKWCGEGELEVGYLEDLGHGDRKRDIAWISGPVERGWLGGAKRRGRERREIEAYRCTRCSHLALFVPAPDNPDRAYV